MALVIGDSLGPYRILAPIGTGGMGEVYRARDSKLNRDVALKILPAQFSSDPDRLVRFKREAQVLASLNHPSIAAIYGFEESGGVRALVLELVEGSTLAERINQGPVSLDEALLIARQIGEALEAAHEQGIIHRDLKPSNIKVRPDGTVKVLDFGLAKALDSGTGRAGEVVGAGGLTDLPTITTPAMTAIGVIIGTAGYMSPEQAKGRPADKRSDMWAFGCVFYEMLTGKRAFKGEDVADTLSAVIRSDPDWSALPEATPASIRRLLRRCLVKDQRRRIADASTARIEIDEALAPAAAVEDQVVQHGLWRRASLAWPMAIAFLIAALALGFMAYRPVRDDAPSIRTLVPLPGGTNLGTPTVVGQGLSLALSPNGRRLVFVATGFDRQSRLWLRSLDSNSAEPLAGTDGATHPFWSPDSRSIGFFTPADHRLRRFDVGSGRVVTLHEDPELGSGGGTWNADGLILFSTSFARVEGARIYRMAASGGTATPITTGDSAAPELHIAPFLLPDGRHFLYTSLPASGPSSVYVGSIDGSSPTLLLRNAANVQYAQGRLLFVRGTTLVAQPFDVARLSLTGEGVPLVEGIAVETFSRTGSFSVSTTGLLVYQADGENVSQLIWFDREGKRTGAVGEPADYNTVNLSPDGRRAVVSLRDAGNMDLWLVDVARGVRTRFTFDPTDNSQAAWSPDGTKIAFDADRLPDRNILLTKAGGSGGAEDVLDKSPIVKYPTSWSSDGKFLLYNSFVGTPRTGNDIWLIPLFGDRKPNPIVQTPFNETRAVFAPDGRWFAYQSNESGQFEVYVAALASPGAKSRISAAGGNSPRWRRDGKELFYVSGDGKLVAVAVNGRGSTFEVGPAHALFTPRIRDQFYGVPYDVTADGQHFLVNTLIEQRVPSSVALIINWPALLR